MSLITRINKVRVSHLVSNTLSSIWFGRHNCQISTSAYLHLIFMLLKRELPLFSILLLSVLLCMSYLNWF